MLASNACPIETEQCLFQTDHEVFTLGGFYSLMSTEEGVYTFRGSAILKIAEHSIDYDEIEGLDLTFIFFNDNVVVHEEMVTLKGKLDTSVKFSQLIKSDVIFKSSRFVEAQLNVLTYEYDLELEDF